VKALNELQRDKEPPGQPGGVLERSGYITESGILYPLTKEEQMALVGRTEARDTSPPAEKKLTVVTNRERDPTAWFLEIDVHTHPSDMSPPSSEDIAAQAKAHGAFAPHKSIVLTPRRMFLMIPTAETAGERRRIGDRGVEAEIHEAAKSFKAEQQPGEEFGKFFRRRIEGSTAAAMKASQMVLYEFSQRSRVFERVRFD